MVGKYGSLASLSADTCFTGSAAVAAEAPGICRALVTPWFWLTLTAFVVIVILPDEGRARQVAFTSLVFPLAVASTMLHPESLACRFLELRPFRYIGRLSYGLYLWQEIFLIHADGVQWPMTVLQRFPFNFLAAAGCTAASYYLLEKPLLALGHRLAPPATPGRQDLPTERESSNRADFGRDVSSPEPIKPAMSPYEEVR